MRFRKGTCGLCKPTKRYKTNSTRRSQRFKKEIQVENPSNIPSSIHLREINK